MMKLLIGMVVFFSGLYLFEYQQWFLFQPSSQKNVLPERAKSLLNSFDELSVDIYAAADSPAGRSVGRFLAPVQKMYDRFEVHYIDPNKKPSMLRDNGVTIRGEMVLKSGEDKRHLTTLSYQDLTDVLQAMSMDQDRWLVFLEGYESREVSSQQSVGYSDVLLALKKRGYPVARAILDANTIIPSNVRALILPAPRVTLNQNVIQWLERQIESGISVWWLQEPELIGRQPQLDVMFDIQSAKKLNQDPLTLNNDWPEHPITQDFSYPIQLFEAMSFSTSSLPIWQYQGLSTLASAQMLKEARLLVTGDADFISNQFIEIAANKSMMFRIVDWLLGYDDLYRWSADPESHKNKQIFLQRSEILTMSILMFLVLPGVYLVVALFHWYKRRFIHVGK